MEDIMFEPKKILVPTDFSKYSDRAVQEAVDIASKYNANVVLLHVIDDNIRQCAADYCLSNEVVKQFEDESMKASKDKLQKSVKVAELKKVDISLEIKRGVPSEVILDEQLKKGIDLIVIASHGKTGILRHLIGSVTDKVIRAAKCPVLVIRE
jgi:universal stress protein A